MLVGIGSKNRAKIGACKKAFNSLQSRFKAELPQPIQFKSLSTKTTVPEMPLLTEDLMKGSLQRALFVYEELRELNLSPQFSIGLEGGVFRASNNGDQPHSFLQNWVYVFDGKHGYFGCSPGLTLPEAISKPLFEEGKELAEVIDQVSGQDDTRSKNGAFGILTRDLLTRSKSFETAIINAMVPFLNKTYYQAELCHGN